MFSKSSLASIISNEKSLKILSQSLSYMMSHFSPVTKSFSLSLASGHLILIYVVWVSLSFSFPSNVFIEFFIIFKLANSFSCHPNVLLNSSNNFFYCFIVFNSISFICLLKKFSMYIDNFYLVKYYFHIFL